MNPALVLLALQLAGVGVPRVEAPTPTPVVRYWTVSLDKMATSKRTHVCTVGPVVYVAKMDDGDWHITLDDGTAKVVVEIIPQIPLARPRKGTRVRACGIRRFDDVHGWVEIHPATSIQELPRNEPRNQGRPPNAKRAPRRPDNRRARRADSAAFRRQPRPQARRHHARRPRRDQTPP